MEYAAARQLLDRLPRFEVKPGLTRIGRLLDLLGHPEQAFPAVHVTGTNGKGSVVAMLASVLRAAGFRVGRYTSPDLVDFRDRICVDEEWIPAPALADLVLRIAPAFDDADPPTQFEALTAMAFAWFRAAGVDVAVVEVGLGGRYDATNVVRPALCILTNVALDHTALLGPTEEAIAWEKAGIAKAGVPMLVGPLSPSVAAVVRRTCDAVGAPLREPMATVRAIGRAGGFATYTVEGDDLPREVQIPLLAPYQLGNLRLVLDATLRLRAAGYSIPQNAVRDGLSRTSWPGRWEVVRAAPTVILDGAHNPAAAAVAADAFRAWEPCRARRLLLIGILAGKDATGIVRCLAPLAAAVGVTRSDSPRALAVEELAQLAREHAEHLIRYDSVEEGLRDLVRRADPKDTLLVTGSLTVVAEARRSLASE